MKITYGFERRTRMSPRKVINEDVSSKCGTKQCAWRQLWMDVNSVWKSKMCSKIVKLCIDAKICVNMCDVCRGKLHMKRWTTDVKAIIVCDETQNGCDSYMGKRGCVGHIRGMCMLWHCGSQQNVDLKTLVWWGKSQVRLHQEAGDLLTRWNWR